MLNDTILVIMADMAVNMKRFFMISKFDNIEMVSFQTNPSF